MQMWDYHSNRLSTKLVDRRPEVPSFAQSSTKHCSQEWAPAVILDNLPIYINSVYLYELSPLVKALYKCPVHNKELEFKSAYYLLQNKHKG